LTSLLRSIIWVLRLGVELTSRSVLLIYFLLVYFIVEKPRWRSVASHQVHLGTGQRTGLWCIFAIAQGRRISQNLIAFLSCLKAAGYNVILVNNGRLSPSLISSFLPHCHSVIERPHGGRDFGGYKWGTNVLLNMQHENNEIAQVIYCNDSNFIRPSHFKWLLDNLKQMDEDYIGVTDSFDPSYHVQSWFFVTSGELFRSPAFQRYWQGYTPLSYRPHCIKKGEIGISAYLSKQGYSPRPLYTQAQILDLIARGTVAEAVGRTIFGLNPDYYRNVAATMQGMASSAGAESDIALSFLKRDLMETIGLSNTMNTTNLILLKYTGFPFLKKDLVYRGNYLFSQIEIATADWAGEDADHLPEIFAYFRARGTLRGQRSPAAILARMGLV